MRLETTLCGITLRNPVLAASGTFGYGLEFASIVDLNQLGGIVTKGLSREPIAGNPAPRLWHTDGGMMNSVGLQNVGVTAFIRDKLPKLREYSVPVVANVFGYAIDDYLEVLRALEDTEGLAAYELNVSCPNTKEGGIFFSSDPALLSTLVSRARAVAKRPLIVKLSPNVAPIEPFAKTAEHSGADAVSLVNTFLSLALNPETHVPRIGAGYGGLSGSAIKPIALRMVSEAAASVRIPVVGIGGISSGEDVAEYLIAGAKAVQVGTATFVDPRAPLRIAKQFMKLGAHGSMLPRPMTLPPNGSPQSSALQNEAMKEIITSPNAPKAAGPYSTAVRENGFVFLSGQIPLDPKTMQLVTGSIEEQTTRVIQNLQAVLESAGLSLAHVVKTTVFLKDMNNFARMNETYAKFFGDNPPARSTVEVARLPRDVQVEIEAIAIDSSGK